jgi:hypothetical protein
MSLECAFYSLCLLLSTLLPTSLKAYKNHVNFFRPDRCLGFSGFVANPAEEWTLQHYAKGENNSLARSGAFSAETSYVLVLESRGVHTRFPRVRVDFIPHEVR